MTPQALTGIRVLDLTLGPAGGLATMVLADFGAEVLLLETPDHPLNQLAATPMWQRGKHKLPINIHTERTLFDELCAGADVLVCNWRPAALERHNLTYAQLQSKHPHLIFCHITGFGPEGPLANVAGYEHVVAALSGRMRVFSGLTDRSGPVFSALQVGIHACAQSALSGILAALISRTEHGHGRLVETSILRGMQAYEQGTALAEQFREQHPHLPLVMPTSEQPPLPSLFYHPALAADGRWMQFGNLLPHLFDNFLITTDLIDLIADPDFNPAQLSLPREKQEAFRERMLNRIQDHNHDEWMAKFIADGGVVAGVCQTTQEAMDDPDITANGHVIEIDGVRQLGPLARLTQTPARPGQLDGTAEDTATRWQHTPRPAPTIDALLDSASTLPLNGLKVVEIATIIAAPLAASFLADMGANVIKIEPVGGDPYRGMGGGIGSTRVNAGKRSLSIDLKSAQGKAAVMRILSTADVLIHNFRPGVPERLGIDYEAVKAINPGIVYLQSNGYGPDGPGAHRPSTHPIPGAAMGGVTYQMGERLPQGDLAFEELRTWCARIMRANEVNPDPNTALVITSSVLLGVMARHINGQGQQILVDMFGANAYANHDDFIQYPDKPYRLLPDEQLQGLNPYYQLYLCSDDRWIFVAAVTPKEQAVLDDLLVETQASSTGSTQASLVADLFASKPHNHWITTLTDAGVACVSADAFTPSQFWLNHEQVAANHMWYPASHALWGDYLRHGSMVTFTNQAAENERSETHKPQARSGAPLAGQDNAAVLIEAGFSADEIDTLTASGVLFSQT